MTNIKEMYPFFRLDCILTHIDYIANTINQNNQERVITQLKYLKSLINQYIEQELTI